jgi:hypothetical protein
VGLIVCAILRFSRATVLELGIPMIALVRQVKIGTMVFLVIDVRNDDGMQ